MFLFLINWKRIVLLRVDIHRSAVNVIVFFTCTIFLLNGAPNYESRSFIRKQWCIMTMFHRYRRLAFILLSCHATYILINWFIIGKLLTSVHFSSDDKGVLTFINVMKEDNISSNISRSGKWVIKFKDGSSKVLNRTNGIDSFDSDHVRKTENQEAHSSLKDTLSTWLSSSSYRHSTLKFAIQQNRSQLQTTALLQNNHSEHNSLKTEQNLKKAQSLVFGMQRNQSQSRNTTRLQAKLSVYNSTEQNSKVVKRLMFGRERNQSQLQTSKHHRYPDPNVSENNSNVTMSLSTSETTSTKETSMPKSKKKSGLIIDTSGCKIPKLDPFDPTVKNLTELRIPYYCPGPPLFMTPEPNGIVRLNTFVLEKYYNTTPEEVKCYFEAIIRKYEEPGNVREISFIVAKARELVFDVPMDYEYIASKCFLNNNYTHEQYFPLVKLKKEVEEVKSKIKPVAPLNVILLGIDSVSKLNFFRQFRKTKPFLKNIKSFDMKGYTKIGDNTFPNLMAMLTGHFVDYYWDETMRDDFFFDNVSLIWKDYARKGFRTFFAEDTPYFGTFNLLKRGFHDPPTDYYYRPMALAIERSNLRAKAREDNSPCLNSEMETELMYDYLKNFVKTMDNRPYFAFCMESMLTHDYLNGAGRADAPTLKLLQVLQDEGALNSSALIIFSDHGLRFGEIRETYIGKFEERMPFMYLHFPEWFLKQHPDIENNLSVNQDRLTTLFDIHATLKHLLHLNESHTEETDEFGLSLFNEIPENRTCADAHIQQHWCPCNSFKQVSVNDSTVLNISLALVEHVNELLLPHANVCSTLEVAEIMDARLGLPNEYLLKYKRLEDDIHHRVVILGDEPPLLVDYLVTLKVKPGGGILEGTVRYDAERALPRVIGVSRINMYGDTSWCINSQSLKLYCYCKKQLT